MSLDPGPGPLVLYVFSDPGFPLLSRRDIWGVGNEKHPLQGSKLCNYLDFKTGAIILNNKEHLTNEGRLKIKSLIGKS